jgi:hypothetical protein
VETGLARVIDDLLADVENLPSVHVSAQLRVLANRLADAFRTGAPLTDAARALEEGAIGALEGDPCFRVYRTARRIVTALTINGPMTGRDRESGGQGSEAGDVGVHQGIMHQRQVDP